MENPISQQNSRLFQIYGVNLDGKLPFYIRMNTVVLQKQISVSSVFDNQNVISKYYLHTVFGERSVTFGQ